MKETDGSKRMGLVKIIKHQARMNEKCGEKTGSNGKELTRKRKIRE